MAFGMDGEEGAWAWRRLESAEAGSHHLSEYDTSVAAPCGAVRSGYQIYWMDEYVHEVDLDWSFDAVGLYGFLLFPDFVLCVVAVMSVLHLSDCRGVLDFAPSAAA